ncbi:hypothetical protein ACH5RR_012812 [Cinchona calisaya]|uniref:Uncharacterized protein n=1 Tax=Cinchona calisaya TaxID=153742 RepID=A0ABD3A8T5_9GENT
MVREFIGNSLDVSGHVVKVREVLASFTKEIINELYHLPTNPNNQFNTFLEGNIDYDEAASALTDGWGTLDIVDGKRKWIRFKYLCLEARAGCNLFGQGYCLFHIPLRLLLIELF